MGTLFLVATPIGNLEDVSARALRILGQVSLIAAEDTRHTGKLLEHFNIKSKLTSYHEHNKLIKLDLILGALRDGDVALVSDAGTPGLNDPGLELIQAVLSAGHLVSPVPGPSAPIAALVSSGLPTDAFLYLGYLPRKPNQRRRLLSGIADLPYTLIFLETPHRLLEALIDLESILGDRMMCAAREMTKLHEEIFRGLISQTREHFSNQLPRGEFTVVVAGSSKQDLEWTEPQVIMAIETALASGESTANILASVIETSGWSRRKVYRLLLDAVERSNYEPG